MKFILVLILGFCVVSCSTEEKKSNAGNQKQADNSQAVSNLPNQTSVPNAKNIKLGEAVNVKPGQILAIQETNLRLLMVITGTAAPVLNPNTGEKGPAVPWCRVEATLNGKTDGRQLFPEAPRNEFIFEGFKITAENITVAGTGSCTLTVTKVEK